MIKNPVCSICGGVMLAGVPGSDEPEWFCPQHPLLGEPADAVDLEDLARRLYRALSTAQDSNGPEVARWLHSNAIYDLVREAEDVFGEVK